MNINAALGMTSERPLQVGDWVELLPSGRGMAYLDFATWPKQIIAVANDGFVRFDEINGPWNCNRFRRVNPPTSEVDEVAELRRQLAEAQRGRDNFENAASHLAEQFAECEEQCRKLHHQLSAVTRERDEYAAVIELVPKEHRIICREGGAEENKSATLCLSVGRLADRIIAAERERDELRESLSESRRIGESVGKMAAERQGQIDGLRRTVAKLKDDYRQVQEAFCECKDAWDKERQEYAEELTRLQGECDKADNLRTETQSLSDHLKEAIKQTNDWKAEATARGEFLDELNEITCHKSWHASVKFVRDVLSDHQAIRGNLEHELIQERSRHLVDTLVNRSYAAFMVIRDLLQEKATLEAGAAAMREALSAGFMTGESNSPEMGRYRVVIAFRDIHSMQRCHTTLVHACNGTAGRELLERHAEELAELRVQLDNERQFFAVNQHTIEAQAEEIKSLEERLCQFKSWGMKMQNLLFGYKRWFEQSGTIAINQEAEIAQVDEATRFESSVLKCHENNVRLLAEAERMLAAKDAEIVQERKLSRSCMSQNARLLRKSRTAKAALVEHYRGKIDGAWFGDEVTYWRYPDSETHRFRVTKHHTQTLRLDGGWSVISTDPKWFTSKANTVCIQCNADGTPLAKGYDDAALLRKLREWIRNGVFTVVGNSVVIGCQCVPTELAELLISIRDGGAK